MVEEGQPDHIARAFGAMLHRAGARTRLHGKDMPPMAGGYTGGAMLDGIGAFLRAAAPELLADAARAPNRPASVAAGPDLSGVVPPRPPGFRTGCPERPIFAATKLVEKELGPHHVWSDIRRHLFSIMPPFEIGGSTMGYGLAPASSSAFNAKGARRTISFIGDGGFWRNVLASSVGDAVFTKADGVIVIVDNNNSAATGGQDILSTRAPNRSRSTGRSIVDAMTGLGATRVRHIERAYDVGRFRDALREALTTEEEGPKVIVVSTECMLNRERREKPLRRKAMAEGERVVVPRLGVDEDVCTGDHA